MARIGRRPLGRRPIYRRVARRIVRRLRRVPVPIERRYGVYIHKQWGADTRTNRTTNTEIVLSATTLLLTTDPGLVAEADASLSLECVVDAFVSAGFPSPWLLRGLEEEGAVEIRRLPRYQILRMRVRQGIPLYPRALAILRLTHIKYGRVRSRTYEYWVLLEITPEGCLPLDWDFGTGKLGRPRVR